ncbi:MAG: class I SAM-dependent methyltransferase [Lachnospiraceae bacterium]|nr:class I SAM-dependent methyltransferase [Lachnospiraceae bacterium]
MEAYTGFAALYDTFMDNVPYEEWSRYLISLLKEYGIDGGLVCELGCGTGSITRRLRDAGYDMIGIDLSEDMLDIARGYEFVEVWEGEEEYAGQEDSEREDGRETAVGQEKAGTARDILYLNQDMREFELYGTVAAIVSLCDSMNYLTKEEDLKKVFELVNNYLDPGGIFIFDMNTIHKYRDLIGDTTIAENREDCSLIWENAYQEETGLNQYDITVFRRLEFEGEEEEELYGRIRETHLQRAYEPETIVRLIGESGLEFVAMYQAGTHDAVTEETERMYFIAREKRHGGKLYLE